MITDALLAYLHFTAPDTERQRMRRMVMIELHLLVLIPLAAVFMGRGLGH